MGMTTVVNSFKGYKYFQVDLQASQELDQFSNIILHVVSVSSRKMTEKVAAVLYLMLVCWSPLTNGRYMYYI